VTFFANSYAFAEMRLTVILKKMFLLLIARKIIPLSLHVVHEI